MRSFTVHVVVGCSPVRLLLLLLPKSAACNWCMGCSGSNAPALSLHERMQPGEVYLLCCCQTFTDSGCTTALLPASSIMHP